MLNAELVRQGYAQVATYSPNVKYQELFVMLPREAQEANRELWGQQHPHEPKTVSLSGEGNRCDVFFQARWSPLWNHCFLLSYRPAPKHARGQTLDGLCLRPIGDS